MRLALAISCLLVAAGSAAADTVVSGDLLIQAGSEPEEWEGTLLIQAGGTPRTISGSVTLLPKVNGVECGHPSECVSGSCATGVCCSTSCNGGCGVCNVPGSEGTCTPVPVGTLCRPVNGTCDQPESCTGGASCPADGFVAAGTVCRESGGLCDPAEQCSGTNGSCPADARAPAGTVCRGAVGLCDVTETCNGTSPQCPPDGRVPAGTACRAAIGLCDATETCNGASPQCPPDAVAPAGTQCRAAAGPCDAVEGCTGTSGSCPPNGFHPSSMVCHANGARCSGSDEQCRVRLASAGCAPDFNGDGFSDVLWNHGGSGNNTVWLTSGLTMIEQPTVVVDPSYLAVGIGDFDGDSKSDILWRNKLTGQNSIWRMNGAQATGELLPTMADPKWHVVGTGDFDGDGKSDILWRNIATGANTLWRMNGAQATAQTLTPVADLDWNVVGVGDFDGDGKSDILWRHLVNGTNIIWRMNGAQATVSSTNSLSDQDWQVAGIGDFDGDFKSDIFWRHQITGTNSIWRMNGTQVTSLAPNPAPPEWSVAGTGDYDRDGRSDVLWRHTSGANSIWRMNGATIVANQALPTLTDPLWRMRCARCTLPLRVLSYNLGALQPIIGTAIPLYGNPEAVLQKLALNIKSNSIHLVGLQELQNSASWHADVHMHNRLVAILQSIGYPMQAHMASRGAFGDGELVNTLLTRYPITDLTTHSISAGGTGRPVILQSAGIQIGGEPLRFYNFHATAGGVACAEINDPIFRAAINTFVGRTSFMTGDFNLTTAYPCYPMLTSTHVNTCLAAGGGTCTSTVDLAVRTDIQPPVPFAIDYVFARFSGWPQTLWNIRRVDTNQQANVPLVMSDHLPVYTQLVRYE